MTFLTRFSTFVLSIGLLILCSSNQGLTQKNTKKTLHSPAEIFKIMEQSKLTYSLNLLDSNETVPVESPQVLHNQFYLAKQDDKIVLKEYELKDSVQKMFDQAEEHFHNEEYNKALELYRKVYHDQPDFYYALTMCGDVHFMTNQLDSAVYYFKQAIAKNPIDYTAYWFLGDTFWKKGQLKLALDHVTRAHVLNKYNPRLLERLEFHRDENGRDWQEWSFDPQYTLSKEGNKVTIKMKKEWMGYVFVKALWKYEPGYAEQMLGYKPDENSINLLEESEAVLSLVSQKHGHERLKKIVKEGYFEPFFYYEIAAPQNAAALLLLPEEELNKIIEYVNKYH